MVRIICIGNRFAYPDNFGMLVYDELKKLDLVDIEVVEGGVGGMSLLPYFEDDKKILIVDYGFSDTKELLSNEDIDRLEIDEYNHSNSFLYLLKMVTKEYKIYLHSGEFNQHLIYKYANNILKIAKGL